MSAFDQIRDVYFGRARAPMQLSPDERRRVLWTSFAPGVIVLAVLISTALSIIYNSYELADGGAGPASFGAGSAPFLIRRAYTVSGILRGLEVIPLALLFAAGLRRWTCAEGSWMILIGTALAAIAVVCGAFVVGVYAATGHDDHGLRTDLWWRMANDFALMAVGYFFLAYRGGTAEEEEAGEGEGGAPQST